MSTIYPVRSFFSHRFFVKVVAALWIVLGLAYMITGVAVYLIFFLFCTRRVPKVMPGYTGLIKASTDCVTGPDLPSPPSTFTNITVKNHPNLSSF